MAWIESHTTLQRHYKILRLATILDIKPVQVIGHIHCLWHNVLELKEDGDISSWTPEETESYALWGGLPNIFYNALKKEVLIEERNGYMLIHDWLDYAGRYLQGKYRTSNSERLKEIEKKHSQTGQTVRPETPPNLPNLTKPNLTINTYATNKTLPLDVFKKFWEIYPSRNGKKLSKAGAEKLFAKIKDVEFELILQAVRNYANSTECRNGYAKDAIRFLRGNYWRDWIEPEKKQPLPEFKNQALVDKLKLEGRL